MTFYDHITALRLQTGLWAEPRPLRAHERELAEMSAHQQASDPEPPSSAGGGLLAWFQSLARARP